MAMPDNKSSVSLKKVEDKYRLEKGKIQLCAGITLYGQVFAKLYKADTRNLENHVFPTSAWADMTPKPCRSASTPTIIFQILTVNLITGVE